MHLYENPFYIFNLSPLDGREKIIERIEEKSLFGDPGKYEASGAALLNPQRRLRAEINWFTETSPRKLNVALEALEDGDPGRTAEVGSLFSPWEEFNLITTSLCHEESVSSHILAARITRIGNVFGLINKSRFIEKINANRKSAGFPLTEMYSFEEAMSEKRGWLRDVIRAQLNKFSPKQLVQTVSLIVDAATGGGYNHAPVIIDDLVDLYEVESQGFFQKEMEAIERLIYEIRLAVEGGKRHSVLLYLTDALGEMILNWNFVAAPIQISMKSRGLSHELDNVLAHKVRKLASDLAVKHEKFGLSLRINASLRRGFLESEEIMQEVEKDIENIKALQG